MIDLPFLEFLPESVRETVIRVAVALLALLLIWLLRRLFAWVILKPVRAFALHRSAATVDDFINDILNIPLNLILLGLGLMIAGAIIMVDGETNAFIQHLSRTFFLLALFVALYNAVGLVVKSSMRLQDLTGIYLDEQLIPFVKTALRGVIIVLAVVTVLQEWNYDVNGLVAGLGLGGLAISLAAKDTIENLFAFTTIISDRPFVEGEYIKTPAVEGTIERVGARTTRIRQSDQAYVTVPNALIAKSPITNWSRLTRRRMDFTLGINYGASSQQLRQLVVDIREMLLSRELVVADSIVVHFVNFGENALEIRIIAAILQANWGAFTAEREAINFLIMDIIEAAGLQIAMTNQVIQVEGLAPRLYHDEPEPTAQQAVDSVPNRNMPDGTSEREA